MLAPPGVPPLLQRRVVKLAREAKLGFEGEPLADRGINPVAVGPPEPRVVGHVRSMLHLLCDSCLSKRAAGSVKYVVAPSSIGVVRAQVGVAPAIVALVLAACGTTAGAPARPPTATEVLDSPDKANVKDAHFTLVAHIVSGTIVFDATGDGIIVVRPQPASKFTMLTTFSGQSLKFQEIIIDAKEYDLSPDNRRWTVKPGTSSSNPSSFKGADAVYLGEATLSQGKAWHVRAKDDNRNPFEAWVRERDGYPLKYWSTMQGSTFTAAFDQFNTGQTVTAPPASDVQP